jgi:hypothetical protein
MTLKEEYRKSDIDPPLTYIQVIDNINHQYSSTHPILKIVKKEK